MSTRTASERARVRASKRTVFILTGFKGFQNKMIITINIVSDLNKILKKDKIENESQKRKNRNLS